MNIFETTQDIEELRTLCKDQNATIKDLREKLDFETDVTRELKDRIVRYDYQYSSLESRISFYEDIIKYLINKE